MADGASERNRMSTVDIPLIIRGKIIETDLQRFDARADGVAFRAPDLTKHLGKLPTSAQSLQDLYAISLDDIIDFMAEVAAQLDFDTNPHLKTAFELSSQTSNLTPSILERVYRNFATNFSREAICRFVDVQIGREYLEGWVPRDLGGGTVLNVRAFGARAVHVIAGNSPGIAFATVLRTALTRSDSIIKLPSNDPVTTIAIMRTMIDVDPNHPVVRHLTAAYWKGGDERVEAALYQPRNIEKIVAWGGFASITHITRYLQPGIDLITMDPKHSGSIVGAEALESDERVDEVAKLAARDIGAMNQELCANARVIYVVCDERDPQQMGRLNRMGERILAELQELPETISTLAKQVNPELQEQLAGIALQDDFFKIYRTADERAGAVVVSQIDEAVEFSDILSNRTANLVPVASVEAALKRISAASQTLGVYPDSLKLQIRDALAIQGAQHIVSLGKVTQVGALGPSDGLQVERRMLKWIRDMQVA
jgi:acyl-CoA reductase LuxC